MKRVLSILVVVALLCAVSLVFVGVGCTTTAAETTGQQKPLQQLKPLQLLQQLRHLKLLQQLRQY